MSLTPEEFEKAKKAFESLKTSMKDGYKIQSEMNKGLGEYAQALKNIAEQQKNINHIEAKLAESIAKRKDIAEKLNAEEERIRNEVARLNALIASGNEADKKRAKEKLVILRKQTIELKEQLAAQDGIISKGKEYLEIQKENLEIARKAAKEASLFVASMRSLSKLPNFAKVWGFDKMKSWGIFEMDKEIRNAARSMNVGAKDFKGFSRNIERAGNATVAWGVDTKQLAVMQRGYSEAIGRSVELTEEGHKAMALMAEGTGLGAEFAVQMASEMDKFGASAETAKDLVAGTIKQAGKVGVNGAAASKKLVSLLKMSQTYVFKGGQEGLKKMAADAERLRLDIEGAAGFAEKVMRPEGAVETAALLTTMGGEFAKLGDPFQLMFKARNDFAGFTKDLGKASSEFVEFNAQTGAFDIKGGLARDRMMEISKITGVQMDKLQEMAVAEKKLQMVQSSAPAGITSQEDKELISSLATVGKGGEIMIKMHGQDPFKIEELNAGMLKDYKQKQQDLEKAAEQSRTFDETISDLINSFKQTLIPFVQALKDGIGTPIQKLIERWNKEGLYKKLADFAEGAGEIVGAIGKFIVDDPFRALAIWAGLKVATWVANGVALGTGFRMVAGKGFGGGGGSATGGGGVAPSPNFMSFGGAASNRGGSGFMTDYKEMRRGGIGRMDSLKMSTQANKWGMGAKMGGMAGLGLGAYGLNSMRGDETDSFYNSGTGKALGIGSSALGGAATGMMFGPWGALIGGLIGGGIGAFNELSGSNSNEPTMHYNDALIANDGKNNGGPGTRIQFNPHDKFMSFDDVMIAGTNAGANGKLADEIKGKGKGDDKSNKGSKLGNVIKVIHEFVMKGIPNKDAMAKLMADSIVDNPALIHMVKVASNKSSNEQDNGGKNTGRGKSGLKGVNNR